MEEWIINHQSASCAIGIFVFSAAYFHWRYDVWNERRCRLAAAALNGLLACNKTTSASGKPCVSEADYAAAALALGDAVFKKL